jgi:hypothetical protein
LREIPEREFSKACSDARRTRALFLANESSVDLIVSIAADAARGANGRTS